MIDNGWGLKDKVLELLPKLFDKSDNEIGVVDTVYIPDLDAKFGLSLDRDGKLKRLSSINSSDDEYEYYEIGFEGRRYSLIMEFVKQLRALAGEKIHIKVNIDNDLGETKLLPGEQLLELEIRCDKTTNNIPTSYVRQGTWTPNWEKTTLVSGW